VIERENEMKNEEIDKHNARVLRDAGYVTKDISGDMSASAEYAPGEDRGPMGSESIRVGDARVMPNRTSFMPNTSKVYATAGDSVVALDPFLHEQAVGTPSGGPAGGARGPIQGYVYIEPDVDARPDSLNFREPEESGIADAAGFRPAQPGDIGVATW
jgi:hypothetical protein